MIQLGRGVAAFQAAKRDTPYRRNFDQLPILQREVGWEQEMDNIQCPNCGRQVVPRLSRRQAFLSSFRYDVNQHVCPFCGVCMYETGGRSTRGGIVALVLIVWVGGPIVVFPVMRFAWYLLMS